MDFEDVASPAEPDGPVMSGAVSSTAATEMVEVAAEESFVPSLTSQEIVRLEVLGSSEVLL